MLVLEYLHVQEDSVRLEGRYIDTTRESIDILIGKEGLTQGKVTYANGQSDWLSVGMCWRMILLLKPPQYVRGAGEMIENPASEENDQPSVWMRIPAMFNWVKLTYDLGMHEMTTEYEVTYA